MEIMRRLIQEEEGQGLVEYALIIALISIGFIAFGDELIAAIENVFDKITGKMAAVIPAA